VEFVFSRHTVADGRVGAGAPLDGLAVDALKRRLVVVFSQRALFNYRFVPPRPFGAGCAPIVVRPIDGFCSGLHRR